MRSRCENGGSLVRSWMAKIQESRSPLFDPEVTIEPIEKTYPPLLAEVENFCSRIDTFPGPGNGRFTDIACKYLDGKDGFLFFHGFEEAHQDGIGFLPGGTARNPYTDWDARCPTGEKMREDFGLQYFENSRFPEERGYMDEHLLGKGDKFLRVVVNVGCILVQGRKLMKDHPPANAAPDRLCLYWLKSTPLAFLSRLKIFPRTFFSCLRWSPAFRFSAEMRYGFCPILPSSSAIPAGVENKIHRAGIDRALGHARLGRRIDTLGKGYPSSLIDGPYTRCSVRCGA